MSLDSTRERLVIAVPKGALYPEAAARLAHAGIVVPTDPGRKLKVLSEDGATEILLLRPTDVPAYVEFGAADCVSSAKTCCGRPIGKSVNWPT